MDDLLWLSFWIKHPPVAGKYLSKTLPQIVLFAERLADSECSNARDEDSPDVIQPLFLHSIAVLYVYRLQKLEHRISPQISASRNSNDALASRNVGGNSNSETSEKCEIVGTRISSRRKCRALRNKNARTRNLIIMDSWLPWYGNGEWYQEVFTFWLSSLEIIPNVGRRKKPPSAFSKLPPFVWFSRL